MVYSNVCPDTLQFVKNIAIHKCNCFPILWTSIVFFLLLYIDAFGKDWVTVDWHTQTDFTDFS